MTAKIITDSTSDLSQEEARRLGITVVPAYVRFGDRIYRDGVDLTPEEFYRKLRTSRQHPYTSAPSPGDFALAYEAALKETKEIVSIHITGKHSVTYSSALLGRDIVMRERKDCRIEVIDSEGVTMWTGLVAIAAKRAADAGHSLYEVVDRVRETILVMRGMAVLATAAYVVRGGRVGHALASVESILHVRTLLSLKEGEIRPAGFVRTREKGIERLREFVRSSSHIEDVAVVHSLVGEEAEALSREIEAEFPGVKPRLAALGPAIGAHAGPGALVVVVNEAPHLA